MQKPFRIVIAAALIGLGVWGWRALFPGPEKVIRSRLAELAKTASFEPGQGPLVRAYNVQKLMGFFTTNVVINLDIQGYGPQMWSGREELQENALLAATRATRGWKVELLDINVTLVPGRQAAVANLTGKVTLQGERDFSEQEFNFMLRKVDGKWLIYRVETVKTLSQHEVIHATLVRNCQ
jgi:hypothetical protein